MSESQSECHLCINNVHQNITYNFLFPSGTNTLNDVHFFLLGLVFIFFSMQFPDHYDSVLASEEHIYTQLRYVLCTLLPLTDGMLKPLRPLLS